MLATVPRTKPAKQHKAPPADDGGLIQTAFRLPPSIIEGLDGLVEEMNQARPWPKMTRSDLVRMVLAKLIEDRPDWLLGEAK